MCTLSFFQQVFPLSSAAFTSPTALMIARKKIAPVRKKHIYILVHGTFAAESSWYRPEGDFYEALKKSLSPITHIIPFVWSGENNHTARKSAAQKLVLLLKRYANHLISGCSHSHGSTVVFLASQQLAQENLPIIIHELIALGSPIYPEWGLPNMHHIRTLYNIFSY